jgi:hypothetical protein
LYASNTVANVIQTRAEEGKKVWQEFGKSLGKVAGKIEKDEERHPLPMPLARTTYLQVQKPQTPGITIIKAPPTPDLQGNPILYANVPE